MITSSRFKITLPIIVQAASSLGLKRGSGLVSPVAINCLAASGLLRVMGGQVVEGRAQLGQVAGVWAAGGHQPEHVGQAIIGRRTRRRARCARPGRGRPR